MKKLLAIIALLLAMVLLLTSCGEKEEESTSKTETKTEATTDSKTEDKKDDTAPAPASASGIEGSWKLTGMKVEGASQEEIDATNQMISSGMLTMTFEFKDGKFTSSGNMSGEDGVNGTGTYKVNGSKLTIVADGAEESASDTTEFKLDGNTLEIEMSAGMVMVFTRQ